MSTSYQQRMIPWMGLPQFPPLFLSAIFIAINLTGCGRSHLPGFDPLPPGIDFKPGVFTDVCPRWSHSGRKIAFLRRYTDRSLQLCICNAELTNVIPIAKPE